MPDQAGQKRRLRLQPYILAIIAGFLALTALLHLPHDMEHWSADFIIANRSKHLQQTNRDIVLVYISETTLAKYPYLSPIDRGLLADLIDKIGTAAPKVIGLDIILDRDTETGKDNQFLNAIRNAKSNLVLGAIDPAGQGRRTQGKYLSVKEEGHGLEVGHLYVPERTEHFKVADHVVRSRAKPFTDEEIGKNTFLKQSFAEALSKASDVKTKRRPALFEWLFPVSSRIDWVLPPRDGSPTFLEVKAEDVLNGTLKVPPDQLFGGKIVLIGGNFEDRDQLLTPLSASDDSFFPGLFIHAQILAQLLESRAIYEFNWLLSLLLVIGAAYAGYWLGSRAGHFYIWLELASVAALFAVWLLAFLIFKVVFPYNLILIAALAGAAAGHYRLVEGRGGHVDGGKDNYPTVAPKVSASGNG